MRLWGLSCLLLLIGLTPATARAWSPVQSLARTSGDQAPVVAANAAGRAAVAWDGARAMEIRVAERGQGFGPVERVPGAGPNITPNDPHLAVGPSGRVIVAWQNYREGTYDPTAQCCGYWRLSVRRGNRFTRSRLLSSRRSDSPSLRIAFDARGRPWVAWEVDVESSRYRVARITATGRIVDRRVVHSPRPDASVDLAGLRIRSDGEPEVLLVVPRGEFQEQSSLVSVRASRPAGPPRTLLVSGTLNSLPLLGLDRFGPRLMVWDNNDNAVLGAVRRGRRFARETVLTRRAGTGVFDYSLAGNSAGAAVLGIVDDPFGTETASIVRVAFASPTSRLRRARRVPSANSDSSPPVALLDDAGRADLAWRTNDEQIAIQSYGDGARLGRVLLPSPGAPADCEGGPPACPAAAGATVGRRGAIFAWRDGRQIRMVRRLG